MKGASVKKVILRFSSGNDPICHSQKFQPSQTPPSHFLPISPRFLENIRCQYFSLNIWVVYDQLELDWCIFDQNWAKTRPLHFQIFQILNATDRPIVQWVKWCSHIGQQMHCWQTVAAGPFWPCFACPKLGDAGKLRVASKNRAVLQKAGRSQFLL